MITLGGFALRSIIPNRLVAEREQRAQRLALTCAHAAAEKALVLRRNKHGTIADARTCAHYAVVNVRSITRALKNRYARQAALPVENDIEALMKLGLKVVAGNLSSHTEKSTIPTPPPSQMNWHRKAGAASTHNSSRCRSP